MSSGIKAQDHAAFGLRQPPWWDLIHKGQATVVEGLMTSEECIVHSKLGYRVSMRPLMTQDGLLVPSHMATVRDDTEDVLGVVSKDYFPVQNVDAFKFFDKVVEEGKAIYETAGSLDGGRRIWILARTGEISVVPGDITKTYLVLSSSHDGSQAVRMGFTNVRVQCANTEAWALSEMGTSGFTHRHTRNVLHRVDDAVQALGLIKKITEKQVEAYDKLINTNPTQEEVEAVISALLPMKDEEDLTERSESIVEANREKVRTLYYESPTCNDNGIGGTAYALYNSLTEFSQYTKQPNRSSENRWNSQLYGADAEFSKDAMKQVLRIC